MSTAAPEGFSADIYRSLAASIGKDADVSFGDEFESQIAQILMGCIASGQLNQEQLGEDETKLAMLGFIGSQVKAEAQQRLEFLGVETMAVDAKFTPLIATLPLKGLLLDKDDEKNLIDPKFEGHLDEFLATSGLDPKKVENPIKVYLFGLTMEMLLAASD